MMDYEKLYFVLTNDKFTLTDIAEIMNAPRITTYDNMFSWANPHRAEIQRERVRNGRRGRPIVKYFISAQA